MTEPILYYPRFFTSPLRLLDVPTAWRGIENGLAAILADFRRSRTGMAIEFGCDWGYSAAALSNFFDHLTTVDLFAGDHHAGQRGPDQYSRVTAALADFPVAVVQADFRDWTKQAEMMDCPSVDLVHCDIVHDYQPTYEALRWAVAHSDLVLAHDTRSFAEVMQACKDVAEESLYLFYEWPEHHGLGILSREGLR